MALFLRVLPYVIVVLVVIGALFGAYEFGRSVERDELTAKHEQQLREIDQATVTAMRWQQEQAATNLHAALEAERQNLEREQVTNTVYKTITEKVVEYVQANPSVAGCGLDADGLRLWNDANSGAVGTHPGGGRSADGEVPSSAPVH